MLGFLGSTFPRWSVSGMDLLPGLICLAAFVAIAAAVVACACFVLEDLRCGYAAIFRKLARNPRFGILTLLEFLGIFAVTFSLLRWAGVLEDSAGAVLALGGIALMLAVGIVASVHLVIGDVRDLYARRARDREKKSGDPWETAEGKDGVRIEPPPGPADEPGEAGRKANG